MINHLSIEEAISLKTKQRNLKRSLLNSVLSTLLLVVTIFCIATPAIATGLFDLPNFERENLWVVDTADAISSVNQNKLSNTFKDLAQATGQEVRMVAIRRLEYGETVDSLAAEIFQDWYPDAQVQANQTLLVLDTLTNNVAIRSGDAAQGLIGAEVAKSIVDDTVGYNIRKGNKYNQAIALLLYFRDRKIQALPSSKMRFKRKVPLLKLKIPTKEVLQSGSLVS